MAHGGSRRVVVIALVANLGIALAKLAAALVTHSGSMLAEAIHSFADTGNQGLLLVGDSRAQRPANDRHPMGYGREAYFWAMLVAVMLFTLGGLFSAYEGVHKLQHPEPLKHIGWAVGVLVFAVVIEAGSCKAAWNEYRRVSQGLPLFRWARTTGDVNLLVVVFEDLAALLGLFIALVALLITWATGLAVFDALGTLVLAALLLGVALFLGSQVRRMITGHSVGPELRAQLEEVWTAHGFRLLRLVAVWAGPNQMTVASKVLPVEKGLSAVQLIARINAAETAVRERLPQVTMQFSEPDELD
jgi:cation diffusion facilitator family transporter